MADINAKLPVDGSGVVQPVSATTLPLPTGAATSANQTGGGQKTQIVDSGGTNLGTSSNPLFTSPGVGVQATEKLDYNTATVAALGTSNHDYTVTATKTFLLTELWASASGGMKIELQVGPVASLVTKGVGFTSSATPYMHMTFNPAIEVPSTSTGTIRVIRTNREGGGGQDVYTTINGHEV